MLTNKEKFLLLVSDEKCDTLERIKYRIEHREEIREQQRIEIERLIAEDKKNKK
jgi:hypothetical protein